MKAALVLGGGAARGFFHVGVIQAIQEKNITITEVAGCSIGAIIGALYAADPMRDFDEIMGKLNILSLAQLSFKRAGFLSTAKIENFLMDLLPLASFEELQIPLRVNATNLNTGEEMVFESGPLVPALLASMAVPGVFPPQRIGKNIYCDGGVVNNIPVHLTKEETVIVSDINLPLKAIHAKSRNPDILYNMMLIPMHYSRSRVLVEKKRNIILLSLAKKAFGADIRKKQMHSLVQAGYESAQGRI